MGNTPEEKDFYKSYKKDGEIELRIELDENEKIFFISGKIKGKIYLKTKEDINYNQKTIDIIYKLTQFQKTEYQNEGEISNNQKDTFKLGMETLKLEKEIEKSFSFDLIDYNKLYPTFEYRNKGYSIYVRHLLTIEIPELNTTNSIGIILSNLPSKIDNNNNLQKNDENKVYQFNIEKLNYCLNEDILVNLIVNNNNINSIELILEKRLEIKKTGIIEILKFFEKENEKIIILFKKEYKGKELKNKIMKFKEILKIDKKKLPSFVDDQKSEIGKSEIDKFIELDENFLERDEHRVELNPSINTELFLCEYKVKLIIHFNKFFFNTTEDFFLIDLYTLKPSSSTDKDN